MKRLLGFIVLLALIGSARGQTYSYRYWLDNNPATLQTGSANGETTIEIDISRLVIGSVHALHLQGFDSENKWGPVRTTYFFLAKQSDTESVTARYWYDNDEITAQTASTTNGLIDFDISRMDVGIHAIHYQTFNAAGEASPARTTYFYMDELQLATLLCRIWIDDDEDTAVTVGLSGEDIVIEAEDISVGIHNLYVVLLDSYGQWLAEGTATFEVKEPMVTITLNSLIETFSSGKDLDFSGVPGLRAYTATGFHRLDGDVMMSRVDDVPAGEGLLLMGEPGTYEVPVRKSYSYYANLLVATPDTTVIAQTSDGYANYLLSFKDGFAGFCRAEDGSILTAGKAYLHIPSGEVSETRRVKIKFDDNPNAVDSFFGETEEGAIFNLAGQRMDRLQKGINIRNGKKIVIK